MWFSLADPSGNVTPQVRTVSLGGVGGRQGDLLVTVRVCWGGDGVGTTAGIQRWRRCVRQSVDNLMPCTVGRASLCAPRQQPTPALHHLTGLLIPQGPISSTWHERALSRSTSAASTPGHHSPALTARGPPPAASSGAGAGTGVGHTTSASRALAGNRQVSFMAKPGLQAAPPGPGSSRLGTVAASPTASPRPASPSGSRPASAGRPASAVRRPADGGGSSGQPDVGSDADVPATHRSSASRQESAGRSRAGIGASNGGSGAKGGGGGKGGGGDGGGGLSSNSELKGVTDGKGERGRARGGGGFAGHGLKA